MFCFDSNGKGKLKGKDNEEGNGESGKGTKMRGRGRDVAFIILTVDDTDDDLLEEVPEKEGVENSIVEDFGLARGK